MINALLCCIVIDRYTFKINSSDEVTLSRLELVQRKADVFFFLFVNEFAENVGTIGKPVALIIGVFQ